MSRPATLARLGTRNAFGSTGRLIILVFLLASALVARSASTLAQAGLCQEAVTSVTTAGLPGDFNCIVYSVGVAYTPESAWHSLRAASGVPWWSRDYITAYVERFLGPGGALTVVKPCNVRYQYRGHYTVADQERNWFEHIVGRYPRDSSELAVPRTFARATRAGIGDDLTLTAEETGESRTFKITGIYEPLGTGPFYEYLLTTYNPDEPINVNMVVANLNSRAIGILRGWAGPNAAQVVEFVDPKDRMNDLARTVYSAQTTAMGLGFGLIGVAVLVVLLVALVERRRESAIYKMVGMNSLATLTVLVVELAWALAIALVLAIPVYWCVAMNYILDVHAAGLDVLVPPFAASAVWTVVVTGAGALYPFAMTSMGSPAQLMTNQKIYLFRRKYTLRGWGDGDVG
ncbi:MAG: hypothetical protein C4551_09915 [Bacillota bacterium]|nr:MAG: hypothetical protein C4551_09915 [Bacillota bacterium]